MSEIIQQIVAAVQHSKFKIEWAKQHINNIEGLIKAVIADNPSVVIIENNLQSGIGATVRIGPKQHIPVALVLHLGDAIHNLNSVMDFLWSGLARACKPELAGKITFPRHETREGLVHSLDHPRGYQAAIQQTFPKARSFVLDDVKPYKGEDHPAIVWHLNKIDNVNKHRLLLAAAYVIRFDSELVFTGSGGGRTIIQSDAAIQTQGQPLTIGLTPPVKMNHDPKAIVDVILAEPEHFTGKALLETLVNLAETVTKVVETFEKTFI